MVFGAFSTSSPFLYPSSLYAVSKATSSFLTLSGADLKEAVGDLAAKPAVKTEPTAKQKKTDQTDTSEKSDHAESEKKEK